MDGCFYTRIWHTRYQAKEYELRDDRVISIWHPFTGVKVRTQIIPCGNWHLRIHEIETNRWIYAVEGGFAIANGERINTVCNAENAMACAPWGVSGICAAKGYKSGEIIRPEPNHNLMDPRTMLPALKVQLSPGKRVLDCVVSGSPSADIRAFDRIPQTLLRVLKDMEEISKCPKFR